MTRPIQIVGGGLAGLSLGIALRRQDIPVEIWEAGTYPRHRVCGEFICGVRDSTLERLGIRDLFADAHQIETASWHLKNQRVFDLKLPFAAMGISRYAIDSRLAERFQKLGGHLHQNARFRSKDDLEPGVVWAAGRIPGKSDLMGLKMHVQDLEMETDLEMHFADGGYAGISWVEDGQANVCALLKRNPKVKASRQELFLSYFRACGMTRVVERLEGATIVPESHCAISSVPEGYCRSRRENTHCAIGDHYGMMGPFTGNGMSMAFESSAMVIDPLTDYAMGKRGWPETVNVVLNSQGQQFRQRLQLSHGLHKIVLNPFGLRALAMLGKWGALPFDYLFRQLR